MCSLPGCCLCQDLCCSELMAGYMIDRGDISVTVLFQMEMLSKTLQFTVCNSAEDMDDQQKEQRGQILPQSYVAWLRKWAGEKAFPMKKFRKAVTGARGSCSACPIRFARTDSGRQRIMRSVS